MTAISSIRKVGAGVGGVACFDEAGLFSLIADKIEQNPELLAVGRKNIERWTVAGTVPGRWLRRWAQILEEAQSSPEGFQRLLAVLREDTPGAERLRDFAPFAGVLTPSERRRFILECACTH